MGYFKLMHRRLLLMLSLVIILALSSVYGSGAVDETRILFDRWISGGEPVMIKLVIDVPKVDADACGVSVYRLSTPLNPAPGGRELVDSVKASPGSTVVVKSLVENAPPVKYRVDGSVEYRDPQEYMITVMCYKADGRVAKLVASDYKVVEVRPAKPIEEVRVAVSLKEPRPFEPIAPSEVEDTPVCSFSSGECTANTGLAILNSIPGVEVSFKLYGVGPRSAMYLSTYEQHCTSWDILTCECYSWGSWIEGGKVIVPSLITYEYPGRVSNGDRAIQMGSVLYKLYYHPGDQDGFAGVCWGGPRYTIAPEAIGSLTGQATIGRYNQPPIPEYAYGPQYGDVEISFYRSPGDAYESDLKIGVSTSIGFCYSLGCASLNIDVYRAGRVDNIYTTPSLTVYDVGGATWYYWWYEDNDPMTYQIHFREYPYR